MFRQSMLLLLTFLLAGSGLAAAPPNILIITVDNLGYGDLQMYNPESEIQTPHLDQLASQGCRLTSFYTASPTCTVSRACLLTGRIPQRHGLTNQLPGVEGNYGVGLSHDEILIPQILKQSSIPYATGCFGKWNIGFAKGSRPTERGFDEFIGHASGNMDYYYHNYREKHDLYQETEELHREGDYATDIFAEAAIDFMTRQTKQGKPWFCYLPFNAPHFPTAGNKIRGEPNIWQAPDWAFETYEWSPEETDPRKRYAAVVTALDRRIGDVLASLDKLNAAGNTFVFFMSDNGAFRLNRDGLDVGINTPLRSGGVTCWEGGLRVPALARYPDHIEAGSVIEQPLWSPDLLIASVELAGAKLPSDRTFDGKNLLPVLIEQAPTPHESFFFQYRNHAALRRDQWKIVREKPNQPWMLFDLSNDLSESRNLADQKPGTVQNLAEEFQRIKNDLENNRAQESP
ncbi:MAG: sulfatase-like hydrolase/transferase [Planctomycetaceae bacterium]|nr:sulfatase-like hydrolase/transferase [Planctomycetaceae bacterium]